MKYRFHTTSSKTVQPAEFRALRTLTCIEAMAYIPPSLPFSEREEAGDGGRGYGVRTGRSDSMCSVLPISLWASGL